MCAQVVLCVRPLLQIIVIVSPLIKLTRVKGAAIDDIGTPEGILNRCAVLCCAMRGLVRVCKSVLLKAPACQSRLVRHHIIGAGRGWVFLQCSACRDHPICVTDTSGR